MISPSNVSPDARGTLVFLTLTIIVATLVTLALYYYRDVVRCLWAPPRPVKRRNLRKSIQLRPAKRRSRATMADAEFRKAAIQQQLDESSRLLLRDMEESSISEEEEYEEYEDYDLDEESLDGMKHELPKSTAAERRRFLIDKDGDTKEAIEALQSYLEWRQTYVNIETKMRQQQTEEYLRQHETSTNDQDLRAWNLASLIAAKANQESLDEPLPRIIRTFQCDGGECDEYTDKCGNVIIKLCPGQIDKRLVSNVKTYSLALALYLDHKLDRSDAHQTVTLIVDVRGGKGWPNPSPRTLLPFLKHSVRLLLDMFPERLYQAIIFPIPGSFRWIWKLVERMMDPETADRCHIVSGEARISSKPPTDDLSEYMSRDSVDIMEQERLKSFKITQ